MNYAGAMDESPLEANRYKTISTRSLNILMLLAILEPTGCAGELLIPVCPRAGAVGVECERANHCKIPSCDSRC